MADVLLVVFSFVLMAISLVFGVVGMDETGSRFMLEIKKKSKPLYEILAGNKRKLSEFEERYIVEDILKYDKSRPDENLLRFKTGFLDKRTDSPYFVRTQKERLGRPPPGTSMEIYEARQKELLDVERAVIGARITYAKNNLPHLPEKNIGH